MANQPFDEEVINQRERPLSSDINLVSSYSPLAMMELIAQACSGRTSFANDAAAPMVPVGAARFIGAGFKARAPGGLNVSLSPGLGFFNDNTPLLAFQNIAGLNYPSIFKPLSLTAAEVIAVPGADPSNPRIDIIEVKVSSGGGLRLTDSTSRDILDPTTGIFAPGAVFKTLTFNLNGTATIGGIGPINYKVGTPSGSPSVPAADAGYVAIAAINVAAAASSIAANDIIDLRGYLAAGNQISLTGFANHGTPALIGNLLAGVEAAMIGGRTASDIVEVFFKVGDASLYSNRNALVTVPGIAGGGGDSFTAGNTTLGLITVDGTLQGQLANGAVSTPTMAAAIGQQLLVLSFYVLNSTTGSTATAVYNAAFQASFGY